MCQCFHCRFSREKSWKRIVNPLTGINACNSSRGSGCGLWRGCWLSEALLGSWGQAMVMEREGGFLLSTQVGQISLCECVCTAAGLPFYPSQPILFHSCLCHFFFKKESEQTKIWPTCCCRILYLVRTQHVFISLIRRNRKKGEGGNVSLLWKVRLKTVFTNV